MTRVPKIVVLCSWFFVLGSWFFVVGALLVVGGFLLKSVLIKWFDASHSHPVSTG